MKNYSLKKINNGDIKYFTISLGLLPGYDLNNDSYSLETIVDAYKGWIQEKLSEKEISFPGKILTGKFIYGFKDGQKVISNSEDAVEIQGEIIRNYCSEIFENDKALLDIITDLAKTLGNTVGQERVHVTFMDDKYILE